MSVDERVATQIAKTLENGRAGYESAAEKVRKEGRDDVASRLTNFAHERRSMAADIEAIAAAYGDDVEARSTVPGALHRGWMALKDAFTGDDIESILATCEKGDEHALEEYREAMTADVSPEFRAVLERQHRNVLAAYDYVRTVGPADEA